jgi:hypothetical protein
MDHDARSTGFHLTGPRFDSDPNSAAGVAVDETMAMRIQYTSG